jgi:hypothetical protein
VFEPISSRHEIPRWRYLELLKEQQDKEQKDGEDETKS